MNQEVRIMVNYKGKKRGLENTRNEPMKNKIIKLLVIWEILIYTSNSSLDSIYAQSAMTNVSARHCTILNGKWQVIIDPTGAGDWRQVWQEKKPEKKTDFIEYSFEGGPSLNVPGDFNSHMTELKYFEGTASPVAATPFFTFHIPFAGGFFDTRCKCSDIFHGLRHTGAGSVPSCSAFAEINNDAADCEFDSPHSTLTFRPTPGTALLRASAPPRTGLAPASYRDLVVRLRHVDSFVFRASELLDAHLLLIPRCRDRDPGGPQTPYSNPL